MRRQALSNLALGNALGGIAHTTIARWLQGSMPHGDAARKLAGYFAVPVDILLDDSKDLPAAITGSLLSANSERIGRRVRERRRFCGLTQRQLAEKIGIVPVAIGRLESNPDYLITRQLVIALGQALACNPDWLETGVGDRAIPSGLTREDREVLRESKINLRATYNALPPSGRETFNAASLADIYYRDMETLLGMALNSRVPFKDLDREREFQGFLRRWGKKEGKGREAIFQAIDLLRMFSALVAGSQLEAKGVLVPPEKT